jgi:hypothetical protein
MATNGSDSSIDLRAKTLAGDLRDAALGLLRGWRKAPHELSEDEQRGLASELQSWADNVVRQAVSIVASRDLAFVEVDLKQATIKTRGVEIKLAMDRDQLDAFSDADRVGKRAVLVLVDPVEYMGERAPVAISPDAPELPLEGEEKTVAEIVRDQWAEDDAAIETDEKAAAVLAKADEAKHGKRKATTAS